MSSPDGLSGNTDKTSPEQRRRVISYLGATPGAGKGTGIHFTFVEQTTGSPQVAATVALGNRELRLYPDRSGRYWWYQLDPRAGGFEDDPQAIPSPEITGTPMPRAVPNAGSDVSASIVYGPVVDVLVARTIGGPTDLEIIHEFEDMNYALIYSDITTRTRLVRIEPVAISTGGATAQDTLDKLYNHPSFQGIRSLRDQIGADLVSVAFDGVNDAAGIATPPPAGGNQAAYGSAFNQALIGQHVVAHEIAHNLGAGHNPENGGTGGPYPYSFANFAPDLYGPGANGKTAVASGDGLSQLVYSSPSVSFPNTATPAGDATNRDNARTIREIAPYVANYRQAVWNTNPLGCPLVCGIVSSTDAVSWTASHLDVFGRGSDGQLYHRYWLGGPWSAWTLLGGSGIGGPGAGSWGNGHIDVFERRADGNLYHQWFLNGGWSGSWALLGAPPGGATSDPDVTSLGYGHLDLFVRGADNAAWHTWFNGSAWQPWQSLGGGLASAPTVAGAINGGYETVVVRGADSNLYSKTFNGTWPALWQPTGVYATSDPDATSAYPNSVDVFYSDGLGYTYQMSWIAGSGGTGDWTAPTLIAVGASPNLGVGATSRGIGKLNVYTVLNQNVTERWKG